MVLYLELLLQLFAYALVYTIGRLFPGFYHFETNPSGAIDICSGIVISWHGISRARYVCKV